MRRVFLFFALFPTFSWATITATSVGYLSATATSGNVNGAFFDSTLGGTNYANQDTFQSSGTVLATSNGTSNPCLVSASGYTFNTLDWLGNTIHVTAGTSWTATTSSGSYHVIVATNSGSDFYVLGNCGNATSLSGGTFYIGGAASLNSTMDGATFNSGFGTNGVGSVTFNMKSGAYTYGAAAGTNPGAGGTQADVVLQGYCTAPGDAPGLYSNCQPSLNMQNDIFSPGANWKVENIYFYGTGTTIFSNGASDKAFMLKIRNNTTTANRNALSFAGASSYAFGIDAVSLRGYACNLAINPLYLGGSYCHDSLFGIHSGGSIASVIDHTYSVNNSSAAFGATAAITVIDVFTNDFFYGAPNQTGNGFQFVPGTTVGYPRLVNSVIAGFNTGILAADNQSSAFSDYNVFSNNGTNWNTNWTEGVHSSSVAINFANVQQFTFSGCTSATNVLTCSGGGFNSTNLVNDQTFVNLTAGSGTGFGLGNYPIHSHTDTTLTLATPEGSAINITTSGSGSSIAGQFTYGNDFRVLPSSPVWAGAGPSVLGNTTTYLDVGAGQHATPGRAWAQ